MIIGAFRSFLVVIEEWEAMSLQSRQANAKNLSRF
jgi:hypothetical protein